MSKPSVRKPWDETMLALLRTSPQAFVDLFLPGARYVQEQPQKLQSHPRIIDGLVEVQLANKTVLLHFEFQAYNDSAMAERLLEYNVLIWNEYQLPVISCVIHLLGDGHIAPSPFERTLSTGKEIVRFHYETVEIGELTAEDILRTGQPGLLPFLTLTKAGATRAVVQRMFSELETCTDQNVTFIAFTIATFSFQRSNQQDLPWLERNYKYMHEIITESPFYKEVISRGLKQGLEQGREQGLEQGLEKGQLTALRQAIVDVVRERFPGFVQFAESQVATMSDTTQLRHLVVKMSIAPDAEQARQAFLDLKQGQ